MSFNRELFNDLAWVIEPPFATYKDIVIPGNLDLSELMALVAHAKPLQDRQYLGCFFGRADVVRGPHPWVGGPLIRETILSWRDEPDLFISEFTELQKMHEAMANSKFCFIPRGKSAWSLRFFESLFTNCVPVVLSDKWELPYEEFLDHSQFVIKWPAANTDGLLDYLRSIPDETIVRYMAAAREVRCWFQYPPKKIDVRQKMRKAANFCLDESVSAYEGILRMLLSKKKMGQSNQYQVQQGTQTWRRVLDTDLLEKRKREHPELYEELVMDSYTGAGVKAEDRVGPQDQGAEDREDRLNPLTSHEPTIPSTFQYSDFYHSMVARNDRLLARKSRPGGVQRPLPILDDEEFAAHARLSKRGRLQAEQENGDGDPVNNRT